MWAGQPEPPGCRDASGPGTGAAGPDVSGTWQTYLPDFAYTLYLKQSDVSVSGSGTAFGTTIPPLRDLTVAGTSTQQGVSLLFLISDGGTVLFEGHVAVRNDSTMLAGTEHVGSDSLALTFYRQ
jgi:hypothetical protein